jgi:hypothetical protein
VVYGRRIGGQAELWKVSTPEREGGVSTIWERMLPDGTPKQLAHFASATIRSFDLSNDGKQLAIDRMTTTKHVILIQDVK